MEAHIVRRRPRTQRLRGGGDDGGGGGDGGEGGGDGEGDDKKKGGGFLSKLNPFGGGKKEDPKDAKKRKEMEEQKKKEEDAARQKKAEIEKAKADRMEAEETARQAAKRERYQQLLQKNPDPTRRVFQFHMKAMKLEYLSGESTAGLFLRVTLGGDYSEREEPGKGLVKKGKKGPVFKTAAAPKLSENDTHYFRNEFGAGIPVYWMGSYVDLEVQEFQVSVSCRKRDEGAAHTRTHTAHRITARLILTPSPSRIHRSS